jgi:hypothetical protein
MTTDRLTLARALEQGGIPRDAAEHIATELLDAIHDNLADKADLQRVAGALRADLQAVNSTLRADLRAVEAGLKAEVPLRLSELEHRMTLCFGSVIVVLTGIILAAIRYLPHS